MQSSIQASILQDGALLLIVTSDYYPNHDAFYNGGGLLDTLRAMKDSLKKGLIKDKAVANFIRTMDSLPTEPAVEVELRRLDGTVIAPEHRVN